MKYIYTFELLNARLTNQTLKLCPLSSCEARYFEFVSGKRVLLELNGSIVFIPRARVRNRCGMEKIAGGTVKSTL